MAGQLADSVIYDYVPFTPVSADTLFGHLLFGLSFARVNTTIARGRVVVDDGDIPNLNETAIRADCEQRAKAIWSRIKA